ncbi:AAA family ATPase [Mycoplasma simbae]|uniref:AAA family ATPase n=1 Tax=Mycoplasma simbae TaxID=36744 RepID=UPI00146FAF3D|nr:AAA family ATPase [Mycoplasma simbae]
MLESLLNLESVNLQTISHDDSGNRQTGGQNIIFYGVPGSGKSYTIDKLCQDQKVTRVVFHPEYTNSDFIGQLLPILKIDEASKQKTISYEFIPGPFTKVIADAYKDPLNKYVLIIEEINRGNSPAIFGDIFQLLDRDQQGNSKYFINNRNIAKIIFGDEDKPIKIPSNLSILGSMNTSDQNVFTLDTAFQRRWSMKMIINDIEKATHKDIKISDTDITWKVFNKVINELILISNVELISSEDKRLGSYFINDSDLADNDTNGQKFSEKVIKYLWDDAFKFSRDKLFNTDYKSLDEIILHFTSSSGNDRLNIFNENIKNHLLTYSVN